MRTQKLPFYLLVGFNLLTWIIYLSNPYLASSTDTHILTVIYVLLNIICLAVGFRTGERVSGSTALVKVTYADNFYKRFYTKYFIFYISVFNCGLVVIYFILWIIHLILPYFVAYVFPYLSTGSSFRVALSSL